MQPDTDGYIVPLLAGWQLTVSAVDGQSIAWLTNNRVGTGFYETVLAGELFLELKRLGYMPTVYHDGGDGPPLVLFHAAQPDRAPYIWEPKSGRVYQAGAPASAGRG